MAEADHVREAAKEAAAVQMVELAGAIALIAVAVVLQVVQRQASEPDFIRTARMRWAKQAERGWAIAAAWSWRRAERFRLEYERASGGH